ncbi:MAG: SpoIIE family protein phosphatase [Actinomycetota bacterium]
MDESKPADPGDAARRIEELERTLGSLREDSEVAYVLLGLSGALAEVRSVEETLDLAVRTIPELFGANRCFAAAWDETQERFVVLAHSGYENEEIALLHKRAEGDGFPLLKAALGERAPVFVSDDASEPGRAAIAIPLVRWGEDFGGLRLEFPGPRSFGAKDAALARGVARQVGVALNNARRFNLLKALRGFGLRIGTGLRMSEVTRLVLAGAGDLLSADAAWLYFLDSSQRTLVSSGASGSDLALPERLARLDLQDARWAPLAEGHTVVVGGLGSEFGQSTDLSALVTPLSSAMTPFLGALMVVFESSKLPGAEESEALSVLATQAAQALENARRFDRQRSVARSLQEGLLRIEAPDVAGFDVGAVYEPADAEADVGGDFYDVIEIPDGNVGVVVGDVSGKGAEAAAQTAMVKYMLRAFAIRNPAPGSVLFHLNNALARDLAEDRFITVVYGVFEPETRSLSLSVAGHPPPLVYRKRDGTVQSMQPAGSILGAFEDQNFAAESIDIEPGDVFLAYTDGLTEARNGDEFYGTERVIQSLKKNALAGRASEISRRIYEDAREFGRVTDDTVVFVFGTDL